MIFSLNLFVKAVALYVCMQEMILPKLMHVRPSPLVLFYNTGEHKLVQGMVHIIQYQYYALHKDSITESRLLNCVPHDFKQSYTF